ncbi:hypothetical protein ACIBEJ_23685 [Nonomuraea sp. NPDC050790]|uniref:hypothetical protein n=1 Tax=Nonomuraea sp. NPDC050790 TaxID=3364371 RepID=UPI00379C72E1
MAQLLRRIDDEVYVEYGTFGLEGTDLESWRTPTPELYHFTAALRLEAWDAEPGPPDASWTPAVSETFVAESGVVSVVTMMEDRGHDFLIGPPHFEYGVAMYIREPRPGDGHTTDECAQTWLLRFWPIRDVFDPLRHAVPFTYITRGVLYYSIDLEPEQLAQPPSEREVPVPVSAVGDWVSLRLDPDGFEGRLHQARTRAGAQNISVYEYLRRRGVDVEDGVELTPEIWGLSGPRPGRFRDPLIDRYYAEQLRRGSVGRSVPEEDGQDHGEWLREEADGERIAKELTRRESRTFSMPVEGRGALYVKSGVSRRLWRWEDDYLGGELMDDGLTVDRQVLAKNPWTRQILVSGIVTILRRDFERHGGGDVVWYVVRDAEPHEAARVLCAEATWEEDPERRRALDDVAREKLIELRAMYS